MMKKILYNLLSGALLFGAVTSCQNFETVNSDPNNPTAMPSHMLMAGAEKRIMDDVYDVWFSGRQCLVYSQFWCQRNYTEEDRYQIRESTNNSYFNYLYQGIANLEQVIKLNSDEETAAVMSIYGANENQIAAAKTLKAWLYLVITDTWGNVPFTESSLLSEELYRPKYDSQEEIYKALLDDLKAAAASIDESEPAFTSGDNIFNGDASKWKKFANSLRCRIAVHLSKTDSNWKSYIAESLADGVFESNADNATYAYSTAASNECGFYTGYFVDNRNDFTLTRPFVDILKGQRDTLNNKAHPWEGVIDPRLSIYTTDRNGQYIGMPLGIASGDATSEMRNTAPNWMANPPLCIRNNFAVPLMTYAELQFILSEYNGFSAAEYKEGIRASIDYWSGMDGTTVPAAALDAYIESVSRTVNAETLALQKYIDLYTNGTEAWTEYRRTGYPVQLLKPNDISCIKDGVALPFTPLSETKGDIVARVKYPTNESTLNGPSFTEAVSKLQDGSNNYYSKMFWDTRSEADPHPANK